MREELLVKARKAAEASVADMTDGPLKTAAFQTILSHLIQEELSVTSDGINADSGRAAQRKRSESRPGGTTSRLLSLLEEGFFDQPRSLAEIKQDLAEKGFHYRLEDIGTPLARLVRRRHLRRSQATVGRKKVWRYSNY
jgi:hypothetical protein